MTTPQQILVRSAHEIAGWTPLWTRLLAQHTPDAGGRCRACPSALFLAPLWPCRIATLAALAQAVNEATGLDRLTEPPRRVPPGRSRRRPSA